MLKVIASAMLVACTLGNAIAQAAATDPSQLSLAADALVAMGEKPDRAQLEKSWRSNFVAAQAKSHNFSNAQAESFFQMIKPSLEAQEQKLFEIRQQSLATAFSHDELVTILAFYRGAVGQKLVQNGRRLAPELAAAQRASFKDFFGHMMAAADTLSSSAAKSTAPATGHVQ